MAVADTFLSDPHFLIHGTTHMFLCAIYNLHGQFKKRSLSCYLGPLCSVLHLDESENALICMMRGERFGIPDAQSGVADGEEEGREKGKSQEPLNGGHAHSPE